MCVFTVQIRDHKDKLIRNIPNIYDVLILVFLYFGNYFQYLLYNDRDSFFSGPVQLQYRSSITPVK